MKKKYESPLAEVLDFDVKDMLMATSGTFSQEEEEVIEDEPDDLETEE